MVCWEAFIHVGVCCRYRSGVQVPTSALAGKSKSHDGAHLACYLMSHSFRSRCTAIKKRACCWLWCLGVGFAGGGPLVGGGMCHVPLAFQHVCCAVLCPAGGVLMSCWTNTNRQSTRYDLVGLFYMGFGGLEL